MEGLAPSAPAHQALGFPPRRVQCQHKCYSDISLLLSITCRLFTASIKYILCSGEIHCTGVSRNSLSFLLQNKTILTSVRFTVNNPSAIGTQWWAGAGRRKRRGKTWGLEEDAEPLTGCRAIWKPGLGRGGCAGRSTSVRRKTSIWEISARSRWLKCLLQREPLLPMWNSPRNSVTPQRPGQGSLCVHPPAGPRVVLSSHGMAEEVQWSHVPKVEINE